MATLVEPVTLEEAKSRLGIRTDFRDQELTRLLIAARQQIETYTQRALIRREFVEPFDRFDQAHLPLTKRPFVSLVGITYLDQDGVDQVVDGGRVLDLTTGAVAAAGVGAAWPAALDPGKVTVTYVAGYDPDAAPGTDDGVPQPLIQAMLLLTGHWFENHEAVVVGTSAVELPLGVRAICRDYRPAGIA